MYCPNCATEAAENQQFCRKCGVNLSIVGKAVTLSETLGRGDRGPLPKVRSMMENLKFDGIGEDISRGLEQMNRAILENSGARKEWTRRHRRNTWGRDAESSASTGDLGVPRHPWEALEALDRSRGGHKSEATMAPDDRRRSYLQRGVAELFSGAGLMLFFYYFAGAVVLRIPPEKLAEFPVDPMLLIHNMWLLGILPIANGLGKLAGAALGGKGKAALAPAPEAAAIPAAPEAASFREPEAGAFREPASSLETSSSPGAASFASVSDADYEPRPVPSVTEHTTSLLDETRAASEETSAPARPERDAAR